MNERLARGGAADTRGGAVIRCALMRKVAGQGLRPVVCGGTGNQGLDPDLSPGHPASYELSGVIGGSASNSPDQPADLSKLGRGVAAAPGTVPPWGTSMAALMLETAHSGVGPARAIGAVSGWRATGRRVSVLRSPAERD